MKIAGPILERKCICISDAWWEKKIKKIWKFEKLLKTFKNIPVRGRGGGWFTLSTLPSTWSVFLISMSTLQISIKSKWYVNKTKKHKPLLLIFLTYFEMQTCFRFMKLCSIELFIEKIWFMYRKGTKNLWIEKYFYFALSNISVFINKNVF